MLPEITLEAWLKDRLAAHKNQPLLTEYVFLDDAQQGDIPTALAESLFIDETKRWIPNIFAPVTDNSQPSPAQVSGFLRWGGMTFPIVSNTAHGQLTVTGDPSLVEDIDQIGWRIVPPIAVQLMTYFAKHEIPVVHTSYPQEPAEIPAFTISLHQDTQGDAYWDESMESSVIDGIEYQTNLTQIDGQYLLGVWAANPTECFWLYAWLRNTYLSSQQLFASWGLFNVGMRGAGLHPSLQFLPERGYVRYFTLAATSPERAINLLSLEAIDRFLVTAYPAYATIRVEEPLP